MLPDTCLHQEVREEACQAWSAKKHFFCRLTRPLNSPENGGLLKAGIQSLFSCLFLVSSPPPTMRLLQKFISEIVLHFLSPVAREKHTRFRWPWTEKTYNGNGMINFTLKLNLSSWSMPVAFKKNWRTQWIMSSITVHKERRYSAQIRTLDSALYKEKSQKASK